MSLSRKRRLHFFVSCVFILFFLDLISRELFFSDNSLVVAVFFSLPSFASVPLVLFFFWSIDFFHEIKASREISFVFVGCILYECLQIFIPGRTFDIVDIWAIILGYISVGLIFWLKNS